MNIKGRYRGGVPEQFDADSQETVFASSPIWFEDDFMGAGHGAIPAAGSASVGYPWVKKIVGAAPPTVARVANQRGGVVRCALTATSEKQDAALYWNDDLSVDILKAANFEARLNLSTLPSGAAAQMVAGLSSAWIDGPDNASFYLEFGAKANGAISMRMQDGVAQKEVASGITVVAGEWHVYRIDATDVTDVKFYIDGNKVSTAGQFSFKATGANAILQAYASMYKASGTTVGSLDIDVIKAWANRV